MCPVEDFGDEDVALIEQYRAQADVEGVAAGQGAAESHLYRRPVGRHHDIIDGSAVEQQLIDDGAVGQPESQQIETAGAGLCLQEQVELTLVADRCLADGERVIGGARQRPRDRAGK